MAELWPKSRGEHLATLVLSLVALPLGLAVFLFNYAAVVLSEQRRRLQYKDARHDQRLTVLITGTANPYGLDLARAFCKHGYRVLGMDIDSLGRWNLAKRSRVLTKHYDLPQMSAVRDAPYLAQFLVRVARKEGVNLWIDCSHDLPVETIVSARQKLEKDRLCACVAIDKPSTTILQNNEAFQVFLKDHDLPTTEVHEVKSRSDIHSILNAAQGKKQYLLRGSGRKPSLNPRTLLPRRTLSQTYHEVSLIRINADSRMFLEEKPSLDSELHCFAVVIRGMVRFFSAQCLDVANRQVLGMSSGLWQALESCTGSVATGLGHGFMGHLNLVCALKEHPTNTGVVSQIVVTRGTFRPDEKFVYTRTSSEQGQLVEAYISAVIGSANGVSHSPVEKPSQHLLLQGYSQKSQERYNLALAVHQSVLQPMRDVVRRRADLSQVLGAIVAFVDLVANQKEAFYSFSDPLPAFWYYFAQNVSPTWASFLDRPLPFD